MVNDDEKIGSHTSVRIPSRMKAMLDDAARANRKSLSAEIVARLAQSLEIDPPAQGPPQSSSVAKLALAKATETEKRLAVIEDALREICSEDYFLDTFNGPAQAFLQNLLKRLPKK
jgi:Arc-like DNA binding domain